MELVLSQRFSCDCATCVLPTSSGSLADERSSEPPAVERPAGLPVIEGPSAELPDDVHRPVPSLERGPAAPEQPADGPDAGPGVELVAEVDSLLDSLAAAVFGDPGALGAVARSLRDAAPRATRQRDLFPLPLSKCGSDFAKAMVAVLNFLYGVRAPVLVPRRVSAAQRAALDNIEAGLREFTVRLLSCSSGPLEPDAWDVFEPNATERRLRDQSACGSCWAFGSVSSFESRDCISTGKDIKYSPEDTAFCSNAGNGCSGGDSAWGYEFGVSRYKMFSKCSTITLRLLAA